ncbi:sensor histidine kinase [Persicitalea jodogahamensis]|uniref:Histidine kinase n=1 Tax=Persicitalea jodogahamensis TaxID=402147 RepID=A0A8J3D6W7_9BACT|nr:histidine kinase [Persicitalea jodogahamensis]GHB61855.1 histidine kinase [Persicitalea jodogahamensis]
MQNFNQRSRIMLLHLSFWAVYFSFFFYQITYARHNQDVVLSRAFLDASLHVLIIAGIAYLNYYYFLSRFLKHKKAVRYLLEFLPPLVLAIFLHVYVKRLIYGGLESGRANFLYGERFLIQNTLSIVFIVVFIGMLRFAEDWFQLEARKKEIENEKLTAELRFLKAQINPHFLFNTLNNLYYLAFTQSPKTTEVIDKLSQMMRYMIYDSNHPKVPLNKEIEYMENYISLEKLRLDDKVPITFLVNGNPRGVMIEPFLFITFLENAFKHGVSTNADTCWVKAEITLAGKQCVYSVSNSRLPQKATEDEKSGIGLHNLRRRLQLGYPDRHELSVRDEADAYSVQLTLRLT